MNVVNRFKLAAEWRSALHPRSVSIDEQRDDDDLRRFKIEDGPYRQHTLAFGEDALAHEASMTLCLCISWTCRTWRMERHGKAQPTLGA